MSDNCTVVGERNEVEELRASRRRLVRAADAERREIERALHDGLQQELIGLAADVELASQAIETDVAAATQHIEELRGGVRHALQEARALASRIYPALDAGGLGPALRLAAAEADVRARVEVDAEASIPPELAGAVYFCWLDVLQHTDDAETTITVAPRGDDVAFEISAEGSLDGSRPALRDRVEALGGSVDVRSDGAARTVWAGSLPIPR
jgi:signal transduction histidine kinase